MKREIATPLPGKIDCCHKGQCKGEGSNADR
jgi:hypothetical protein